VIEILLYIDGKGRSPFEDRFNRLNPIHATKIVTALYRLEQGNVSNVKSVGKGVSEYKIDFGPGFRIYFGQDGDSVIILLCGGTKRRQQKDISFAIANWEEYKSRKKEMR
jgi:putative addiction module killer protein